MSSVGKPSGATVEGEKEKRGLGKIFSRAKGLLRKGESSSSKRRATLPTPVKITEPVNETTAPKKNVPRRFEDEEGVTTQPKSQILEERAKKLGERFGLEIKASEWTVAPPDATVLRMDKPIRMRVRRNCHRCDATFTSAKECPKCQHVRCNKCVRHPPTLSEEEKVAHRERRVALIKANKENAPIVADWTFDAVKAEPLKKPAKKNGQDLVLKKPRQRVRRNCHECSTLFVPGAKDCASCGHKRCTDCPRHPPKKDKYPFGYPGDEFGPNSIPRFECEECSTIYPTGTEHGVECEKCGHPKSESSKRVQPRKVEPELNVEVLKQIQNRLDKLKIEV